MSRFVDAVGLSRPTPQPAVNVVDPVTPAAASSVNALTRLGVADRQLLAARIQAATRLRIAQAQLQAQQAALQEQIKADKELAQLRGEQFQRLNETNLQINREREAAQMQRLQAQQEFAAQQAELDRQQQERLAQEAREAQREMLRTQTELQAAALEGQVDIAKSVQERLIKAQEREEQAQKALVTQNLAKQIVEEGNVGLVSELQDAFIGNEENPGVLTRQNELFTKFATTTAEVVPGVLSSKRFPLAGKDFISALVDALPLDEAGARDVDKARSDLKRLFTTAANRAALVERLRAAGQALPADRQVGVDLGRQIIESLADNGVDKAALDGIITGIEKQLQQFSVTPGSEKVRGFTKERAAQLRRALMGITAPAELGGLAIPVDPPERKIRILRQTLEDVSQLAGVLTSDPNKVASFVAQLRRVDPTLAEKAQRTIDLMEERVRQQLRAAGVSNPESFLGPDGLGFAMAGQEELQALISAFEDEQSRAVSEGQVQSTELQADLLRRFSERALRSGSASRP